eukprot:symbB.v1.2.026955.t2/scaffold2731.1/size72017/3
MASKQEKADEAAAAKYRGLDLSLGACIYVAARDGELPALRHFLRVAPERVDEKHRDFNGQTPLHVAAAEGHVAAAQLLLSKGAAVDATDIVGWTPLHFAAINGHVAAAELLLSKGAAVDAKMNDGRTPLHRAALMGRVKAAELLLSKGAALDSKDDDGKTPLDLAREKGRTEMEQFLLNRPAKKPSADDGKTPRELSSKGKAGKEPLPAAADKTSEAGKKEASCKPPESRQTSKKDAAPHAAGSGAVAVKHQRETSKEEADRPALPAEEAAKALKKAMESGNVQNLKEAIAAAKAEKVSHEDVLEAMDKLIALTESANQHELSPAEEAAKALKKAMESGNVQNLKEAIAAAKAEKVSHEDVLEAMDKLIALTESAATSKAEKSVTTSKAESSVKLEPGNGARLAMFSARFNARNKETETKFRAVHKLLVENQYEVLMVEAGEGESFGDLTAQYLGRLKRENGIMLAVCTSDYGEMTDSPFCTYYELKSAVEYKIDVLPLQVEDEWQPKPPSGKGHLDEHHKALGFIDLVFSPSRVRLDCRDKPVVEIASKIAAILRKPV